MKKTKNQIMFKYFIKDVIKVLTIILGISITIAFGFIFPVEFLMEQKNVDFAEGSAWYFIIMIGAFIFSVSFSFAFTCLIGIKGSIVQHYETRYYTRLDNVEEDL